MLVLNILQFAAQIANLIAIFVLIAVIKRKGDPEWEPSNDVYRSLLLFFLFLSILRLFGFAWLINLIWKLKTNLHNKEESSSPDTERIQINDSDFQGKILKGI